MLVSFYSNKSDNRYINKSITLIHSNIGCELKDDTNLLTPTLILTNLSNLDNINYVYIPDFNRYYYVTDIEFAQQRIYISLKCDVLMSFKNDILKCRCIIERQENNVNRYLIDNEQQAFAYTRIQTKEFPNGFNGYSCLITILGGR